MKAFQEWLFGRHRNPVKVVDAQREGWKAALEWLYDHLDYNIEHEEIKDIINEEIRK